MITGLTYAIVTTDDVPRARKFFRDKLGLSTEDDMGDAFSQFYLQVGNVDEAHKVWSERGVEMVTEPHNEPFGRTFAFKDADGRVLHAYSPT
jgi:predicted enzyme related to lactoylglutathione lyase